MSAGPDPDGVGRPWCGAPARFGGQQPCPLPEACDARTCRLGSAVGAESYGTPTGDGQAHGPAVLPLDGPACVCGRYGCERLDG